MLTDVLPGTWAASEDPTRIDRDYEQLREGMCRRAISAADAVSA